MISLQVDDPLKSPGDGAHSHVLSEMLSCNDDHTSNNTNQVKKNPILYIHTYVCTHVCMYNYELESVKRRQNR